MAAVYSGRSGVSMKMLNINRMSKEIAKRTTFSVIFWMLFLLLSFTQLLVLALGIDFLYKDVGDRVDAFLLVTSCVILAGWILYRLQAAHLYVYMLIIGLVILADHTFYTLYEFGPQVKGFHLANFIFSPWILLTLVTLVGSFILRKKESVVNALMGDSLKYVTPILVGLCLLPCEIITVVYMYSYFKSSLLFTVALAGQLFLSFLILLSLVPIKTLFVRREEGKGKLHKQKSEKSAYQTNSYRA